MVNDTASDLPLVPAPLASQIATPQPAPPARLLWWIAAGVIAATSALSLSMAWKAQRHVGALEQELVRRQQSSANQSAEAQMLAKQAQDNAMASAAKVALVEARVAEVTLQRTQLEELIQSLSRSQDENLLVDIEAGIRVALQQGAITGSAEPLVAVLKQSDERLARASQPRLQAVRRAIARDLERVKAVGTTDIASLTLRLDDAIRTVDELPMLFSAEGRPQAVLAAAPASAPVAPVTTNASGAVWIEAGRSLAGRVWSEVRSLVRVTRIDHPDAMLMAPEQAYFLRENLKLRLLNARLALLSRQYDTARLDLQIAQQAIERHFDRRSPRTALATEALKQVAAQSRSVHLPRPDDTLAALAAAGAGR